MSLGIEALNRSEIRPKSISQVMGEKWTVVKSAEIKDNENAPDPFAWVYIVKERGVCDEDRPSEERIEPEIISCPNADSMLMVKGDLSGYRVLVVGEDSTVVYVTIKQLTATFEGEMVDEDVVVVDTVFRYKDNGDIGITPLLRLIGKRVKFGWRAGAAYLPVNIFLDLEMPESTDTTLELELTHSR